MIKSMTGYGRAKETVGTKEITVEIKSVNHRFFECSVRSPRNYGFLDERLKAKAMQYTTRGKIDIYVAVNDVGEKSTDIKVNSAMLDGYYNALKTVAAHKGVKNDISVSLLSKYSDIFEIDCREDDAEEIWRAVSAVADTAFTAFNEMRAVEGEKMLADMGARSKAIAQSTLEVDRLAKAAVPEYKEKLTAKVKELLDGADAQLDESRILTEVTLYANKIAVDEETVRLRSHMSQFDQMLESNAPIGKKADFLVQEMNREANTMGSKSDSIEIRRIVVDIKTEIEKIREQIQNVE